MNDNWSDFEKYVFKQFEKVNLKIDKVDKRIFVIETKSAMIGMAVSFLVSLILQWLK